MRQSILFGAFAALGIAAGCGSDSRVANGNSTGASGTSNAASGTGTGGASSSASGGGSSATGTTSATGAGGASTSTSSTGTASTGAGGASMGPDKIKTVFVIVMENKTWKEVKASAQAKYINEKLLPMASYAEMYKGALQGNLHPSEPNYLWLEAGDNFGVYNDNDPAQNHQKTDKHLVTLMDKAGVTWKSYQEDISGTDCPLVSVKAYKPKHNPMVFFDDVTETNNPMSKKCIDHNRPLPEFEQDLKNGKVAQYNFVTPNMCHDMHDPCAPQNNPIQQGSEWLAEWIPKITASAQYQAGGAIFITWDEGEPTADCFLGNCEIGMVVVSPLAKGGGYTNKIAYDHSSTLKTIQEIFAVQPLLGGAGSAGTKDMADLFVKFP